MFMSSEGPTILQPNASPRRPPFKSLYHCL